MESQKTIERLIVYKILLEKLLGKGSDNIYSHQLADLSRFTAAQVRRDLMAVGYTGNPKKGYCVSSLLQSIKTHIEPESGVTMVVVGLGNLGKAILKYFSATKKHLTIVAAFDVDEEKINREVAGCYCYHISEIGKVIQKNNVQVGAITVPASKAQKAADLLIIAGVKGIVNFAPTRIKVPQWVYIEYSDITLTFEKAAYFSRKMNRG